MEPEEIAVAVERSVLAHPAVVRLDAGPLGAVATHAPGRRINGVAVSGRGERVEIAVVVRLGGALDELTVRLRDIVRDTVGDVPVDVTVSDVEVEP